MRCTLGTHYVPGSLKNVSTGRRFKAPAGLVVLGGAVGVHMFEGVAFHLPAGVLVLGSQLSKPPAQDLWCRHILMNVATVLFKKNSFYGQSGGMRAKSGAGKDAGVGAGERV